jgi:rhodanese-related sulfurtransferase
MLKRHVQEMVAEAKARIRECAPLATAAMMAAGDWLLLDVRESDEYAAGHLAGALNVPRGLLEFRLSGDAALGDTSRPVLVYCKTSGRAALAALVMQEMGFAHVVSMAGGFDAWEAAGLPVAKPQVLGFD